METPTRNSDVAPEATTCARCRGSDSVTSVTITGRVVYLRCKRCGVFWSIPERRASYRIQDAHKVFEVFR